MVVADPAPFAQARDVLLDDAFLAGSSRDGVASREGVFQELRSGTDADRISFVADVNRDGVSDLVGYELVEGDLVRSMRPQRDAAWGPAARAILAHEVRSLQIRLFDGQRKELPAEAVIRLDAESRRRQALEVRVRIEELGGSVLTLNGEVNLSSLMG